MKNLLKILSLNNVNEDCLIQIQAIAKTVNLKSHKNILDYGNYCSHIFFVLKGGFLCKYWNDKNESERTINFYLDTSQPFMTSIDSYFNQTKSIYSLQSFTNSDILIFKRTDLEILTNEYKSFDNFYKNEIIKALISENEFRSKLIVNTPQEIYKELIKDYPEIVKKVPSKYIADFMGISPVWLSKLKKNL